MTPEENKWDFRVQCSQKKIDDTAHVTDELIVAGEGTNE